jgi:hypothetical protein
MTNKADARQCASALLASEVQRFQRVRCSPRSRSRPHGSPVKGPRSHRSAHAYHDPRGRTAPPDHAQPILNRPL